MEQHFNKTFGITCDLIFYVITFKYFYKGQTTNYSLYITLGILNYVLDPNQYSCLCQY